jgi:hypothetical protein
MLDINAAMTDDMTALTIGMSASHRKVSLTKNKWKIK